MDSGQMTHEDIMAAWYRFAATQSGFCESYLKLHRMHRFLTQEQQQTMFGATNEQFLHLRGFPLPSTSTTDTKFDALMRQIAVRCGIRSSYLTAVVQAFREARLIAISASNREDGSK